MGYSFVSTIAFILVINLVNMFYSMFERFRINIHKTINQKIYEKRFSNYAKVERLCYLIKYERILMERKMSQIQNNQNPFRGLGGEISQETY